MNKKQQQQKENKNTVNTEMAEMSELSNNIKVTIKKVLTRASMDMLATNEQKKIPEEKQKI